MRSSKSRSRSKSNRSRSVGNIVNRVFDSSGPEGKVRGTPQQIIDKYSQLARDATLSNDRVAAENFQQHAEHYTRMLGDAQREMDAKREQQEAQAQAQREQRQQNHQPQRDDRSDEGDRDDDAPKADRAGQDQGAGGMAVSSPEEDGESGLVETPENKPQPKPRKPRTRKPRAPKGEDKGDAAEAAPKPQDTGGSPDVPEAAE